MGWVHERFTGVTSWHWKYYVMTDCSLLTFDKAPSTSHALEKTSTGLLLFECKQRQTPPSQSEIESRQYSFMLMSHLPAVLVSTGTFCVCCRLFLTTEQQHRDADGAHKLAQRTQGHDNERPSRCHGLFVSFFLCWLTHARNRSSSTLSTLRASLRSSL